MAQSGSSTAPMDAVERRLRILSFIGEYSAARGYSPTVREIGFAVGLTSVSSVVYQLDILSAHGKLAREPGIPRSIRVVAHEVVER